MVKPLVQFRLSDDEIELLRFFSEEGESEGLTAKRLLLQLIGAEKEAANTTSLPLTENLKVAIAEEVEHQISNLINSSNDILLNAQREIKELQAKVLELSEARSPKKRGRPRKDSSAVAE